MASQSASDPLEIEQVYVMHETMVRGAMRVELRDREINPVALVRGQAGFLPPVAFSQFMGGKPRDLVGTGRGGVFLLSERFLALLNNGGFTGWRAYPVDIRASDGSILRGYSGLAVTGRCGPIDASRSRSVILQPRGPKGQAVAGRRGLFFDETTWDGSDIFVPANADHVFVLAAVRTAVERARLTNVTFDKATELEMIHV